MCIRDRVRGPEGSRLLTADAYVVALGSYTPLLLRPLGVSLPVIPAKGYSATVPLSTAAVAPTVSLTDDEHRLVFSRLGNRLRIAGTAEVNGYNLDLNPVRCTALLQRARQFFPALEAAGEPQFWCGLRPVSYTHLDVYKRQVKSCGKKTLDDLYTDIGLGKRLPSVLARRLLAREDLSANSPSDVALAIHGTEGMAIQLARCCQPIPGDPEVAFERAASMDQ